MNNVKDYEYDTLVAKKGESCLFDLAVAMEQAITKHPEFCNSVVHGINIITEEFLELVRAVNDNECVERQQEEALHLAVTAMRLWMHLEAAQK